MKSIPVLLQQMSLLALVSAVLGVSAQVVLPNGIGLKTELTIVSSDSGQVSIPTLSINPNGNTESASNISLRGAFEAHENGTAIFIDARSPEEFQKGHIQAAINMPVHAFMDSMAFLENLDFGTPIITYCDGEDCNASIDLAADLKLMGFSQVVFFFGGWLEWQAAGYPIETGS